MNSMVSGSRVRRAPATHRMLHGRSTASGLCPRPQVVPRRSRGQSAPCILEQEIKRGKERRVDALAAECDAVVHAVFECALESKTHVTYSAG